MTAKCLMSISTVRTALVMSSRPVQDRRAQTNRCSNAELQLCFLLPPGLPSCWIATGDDSSGSCSCQQTSHVGFRNCTPHGLHQVPRQDEDEATIEAPEARFVPEAPTTTSVCFESQACDTRVVRNGSTCDTSDFISVQGHLAPRLLSPVGIHDFHKMHGCQLATNEADQISVLQASAAARQEIRCKHKVLNDLAPRFLRQIWASCNCAGLRRLGQLGHEHQLSRPSSHLLPESPTTTRHAGDDMERLHNSCCQKVVRNRNTELWVDCLGLPRT